MAIQFICPHCKKKLVAESNFAGKKGKCFFCGKELVVPEGETKVSKEEKRAG
jgi:hypothetical protein